MRWVYVGVWVWVKGLGVWKGSRGRAAVEQLGASHGELDSPLNLAAPPSHITLTHGCPSSLTPKHPHLKTLQLPRPDHSTATMQLIQGVSSRTVPTHVYHYLDEQFTSKR